MRILATLASRRAFGSLALGSNSMKTRVNSGRSRTGARCMLGSGVIALALGAWGCAPNSMEVVRETAQSWDSDNYIPATDPRGVRKNAARVLSTREVPQKRVMTVGSKSTVVFEDPSVRSRPLGLLKAGDAVRVTMAADFVRIAPDGKPDRTAGDMREYVGYGGAGKPQVTTPSWVQVDAGGITGWVPARVLVDPRATATATSNLTLAREAASEGTAAKGFSEKMKVKSTAMKGGMGEVQVKDANVKAADELLARCAAPMNLHVSRYPSFHPVPRLQGLPEIGRPLHEVDPQLSVEVSESAMDAAMGGAVGQAAEATGNMLGALSNFGVSGAAEGQQAARALQVAGQLLAEYPLTAEEERIISRQCLAQTVGNTPYLASDHPLSAYVNWVGAWVASQSTLPYPASGLDVVVLVDRSTMNAMAVPGGPILITTGMLSFLQSEDELAFLLAHEMAHLEERHGFKQLNDNRLVRQLAAVLSLRSLAASGKLDPLLDKIFDKADVPANLRGEGREWLKGQIEKLGPAIMDEISAQVITKIMSGTDQGIETAADLRGLSLTAAAGYNPAAAESLLQRMENFSGNYGGAKYSSNRLEEARAMIPKLPSRSGGMCKTLADSGGSITPSLRAQQNWAQAQQYLSQM